MRKRRFRRQALATSAVVLALCIGAGGEIRSAHASIFGEENAPLYGILAQTTATVAALGQQLTQIVALVQANRQMLGHLDHASYGQLRALLERNEYTYDRLTRDVRSMGFRLLQIDDEFRAVFPDDAALARARPEDFGPMRVRWHNEIRDTSRVAARAQTRVSTLEGNTRAAQAIVNQSENNENVVGQLQTVVQMLAVLEEQMNSVIESLDTAGRVTGTVAASSASERAASLEQGRRLMRDFRNRGVPVGTIPDPIPPREP